MRAPHTTKRWLILCLFLVLIAAVGCTMIQDDTSSAEVMIATEAGTPAPPAATATVEAAVTTEAEEAFILRSSIWDQSTIGVCWDTLGFDTEKTWVRDAVARTWEQESALRFVDWQQCGANSRGIRITVRDAGPHVKVLGRFLNGRLDGMVLNFTFQNWSREFCTASEARRQFCIEAIGVHEFGHAIGFAHEQNRPDAPQWCQDQAQGTNGDWLVTAFDLDSIMNYCNPDWNNTGLLSELDIQAARTLYGGPQEIVDGDDEAPTQRNNMHACPVGWYVVGVHVNRNVFLCSNEFGVYELSQEFVDGDDEAPTQRNNMHTCPAGSAVTGLHVDNNWLSCAPVTGGILSQFVDSEPVTVRANMHACPEGSVLLGIHVDNNQLLCGQLLAHLGPREIIDGDDEPVTVRNSMHTCPEGWYMVGVHVGNNYLLCSNEFGSYQVSQEYVDGDDEAPTQRNNMHACPVGSAITGIHVDNNWLSCAPVTDGIDAEFVDGDDEAATVRSNMHACPRGNVLLGIHVNNNQLLCGR